MKKTRLEEMADEMGVMTAGMEEVPQEEADEVMVYEEGTGTEA